MCVFVCACMCLQAWVCVCVCVCESVFMCLCVFVSVSGFTKLLFSLLYLDTEMHLPASPLLLLDARALVTF
jgi:hypothetical protein